MCVAHKKDEAKYIQFKNKFLIINTLILNSSHFRKSKTQIRCELILLTEQIENRLKRLSVMLNKRNFTDISLAESFQKIKYHYKRLKEVKQLIDKDQLPKSELEGVAFIYNRAKNEYDTTNPAMF